jgi:hypothetical protein
LKAEVKALMERHGVKNSRAKPVKRKYAFEDPAIPHGEQWVLKVRMFCEARAFAKNLAVGGWYGCFVSSCSSTQ